VTGQSGSLADAMTATAEAKTKLEEASALLAKAGLFHAHMEDTVRSHGLPTTDLLTVLAKCSVALAATRASTNTVTELQDMQVGLMERE
jgi:hypothetical protein